MGAASTEENRGEKKELYTEKEATSRPMLLFFGNKLFASGRDLQRKGLLFSTLSIFLRPGKSIVGIRFFLEPAMAQQLYLFRFSFLSRSQWLFFNLPILITIYWTASLAWGLKARLWSQTGWLHYLRHLLPV